MEITPIIKINVVGGEGASGIHEIQFFKRLPYETTFIVNVDFMKFQIIYFSSVCPFKYTKFLNDKFINIQGHTVSLPLHECIL